VATGEVSREAVEADIVVIDHAVSTSTRRASINFRKTPHVRRRDDTAARADSVAISTGSTVASRDLKAHAVRGALREASRSVATSRPVADQGVNRSE
jgi:hypothetical protein